MNLPIKRRSRLAAWLLIAITLSLGQCLWLVHPHPSLLPGIFVGQLLIASLSALLLTTPPDAIKLPRLTSEFLILVITATLQLCAGWNVWINSVVILLAAILLFTSRRTNLTPWWSTLILWNPLLSVAPILAIHAVK